MKRVLLLSIIALTTALSAMPAYAQYSNGYQLGNYFNNRWSADSRIDTMQSRLQARINQGISDGRLSQSEASRLQSKLSKIANLEARLRMSGNRLTFNERNKINRQLDSLNMQISREMNDFERRRVGFFNNRFWR